jgi:hypothetical protein
MERMNSDGQSGLLVEYKKFLDARKADSSPREAHIFALALKHKGEQDDRTVEDIVRELVGVLPDYWTDPFNLESR